MDLYPVVPLVACIVSAGVASRTWAREPDNQQIWPIAGLSGIGCAWAAFEVLWNSANDPASALFWARASTLATVPLGPIALHSLAIACDMDTPRLRRQLLWIHVAGAVLIGAAVTTPWLITHMTRTWWGWSPNTGPLLLVQYALVVSCIGAGFSNFRKRVPRAQEATIAPVITLSTIIPLFVVSATDVALPTLDFHDIPRLGSSSIALIGILHTYATYNRGEFLLLPQGVTAEVLRALPDGVVSLSVDGLIRSANNRFASLVGVAPESLIGRHIGRHLPAELFADPTPLQDIECVLTNADGHPVDAAVSVSLRETLGATTSILVIVRDQREVAALRKRLLVSGRMAAVGELAAGIAHELNNPIAYVRSNLAVLRDNTEQVEKELRTLPHWNQLEELAADCENIIDESLEGIDRAAAIVRDVREFSHTSNSATGPTDLSDVIAKSVRVARLQIRKQISVAVDVPEIPFVPGNGQRLLQVLVNLLVNAGHAIEDTGTIQVSAETDAGGVTIRIRDSGCGIPPQYLERIFDPFFTTKPVGVGTGLGLAIAFGIIEEHDGRIEVESDVGEGTQVSLWLPSGDAEPAAAAN